MRLSIASILLALIILSCQEKKSGINLLPYPETKIADQADDYFGTKVSDPYRWLENDTSAETAEWVKEENAVTFAYLKQIPCRTSIRARLDELLNYPRESAPNRAGNYYFFTRNTGLQNQDVIYVKEGLNGEESVFIDPNQFAEDGTVTFNIVSFSKDNRYVAVSKSEAGSDWRQLIVYDIATRAATGDTLRWIKFSGASWYGQGFYYSRYPEPLKGSDYSASNTFHTVCYHQLGDSQENDEIVYRDEAHPNRYHWADMTEDDAYLVLYIAEGTDGFECHYKKPGSAEAFHPLFTGFANKSSVVDHLNGKFYVRTNIDAPNYRLMSVDPESPEPDHWTDLIPEKKHLLQSVSSAGGQLFVNYLENAHSRIYRYDISGKETGEIPMPAEGSVYGFGGRPDDSLLFYTFSSFTFPGSIYSYNVRKGESELYYQAQLSFNPNDYESKQVFYPSSDGTEISMFIVYKKGTEMDGNNPCLLYGYGGFNINLTPGFSSARLPWLENGGIFAMPNLRGGGEYGEEWHKAGMLLKKQNVFNDFIAAAEYLIREKYTSSDKLVISGRSNGGLLVGAVMTQRPDLMKVALPGVGVMDMLRYHQFTVGHGWVPEYGSSEEEEHFRNLLTYSPLHNLKEGVRYPATLVYTGDHDDRVVPAHSFKFAATLQKNQAGELPVLIRIETQAGHGAGKPMSKMLDEEADKLAFSFYHTGMANCMD